MYLGTSTGTIPYVGTYVCIQSIYVCPVARSGSDPISLIGYIIQNREVPAPFDCLTFGQRNSTNLSNIDAHKRTRTLVWPRLTSTYVVVKPAQKVRQPSYNLSAKHMNRYESRMGPRLTNIWVWGQKERLELCRLAALWIGSLL